jgi:hypothetical protein
MISRFLLTGERHCERMADDDKYDVIPASQRPDGTWRKEIRVRKGYVPQDEVKKFETKGSQ